MMDFRKASIISGILILIGSCQATCFESRDELRQAVKEYLIDNSPDTSVANKHGWPIGKWCVSNVTDFTGIFENATNFNENLSDWDVSRATSMERMFKMASSFDQPLNSWSVANVMDLRFIFSGASSFNQDLFSWEVSSVISMKSAFFGAAVFNGDVSPWDVENCMDMSALFLGATSFNGDVSGWKVTDQTKMNDIFSDATSFRQDLCAWGPKLQKRTGGNLFAGTGCPTTSDPDWFKATAGPFCYECHGQEVAQTAVSSQFRMLPYKLFAFIAMLAAVLIVRKVRGRDKAGIDPADHELPEFQTLQLSDV
jgi:hypothetical protein